MSNSFVFEPFSKRQKKLLFWWHENSPYSDMDIVIADGAIRSGKTIAMVCSFLMWSQKNFRGKNFIIAGKSIGTLKRNVISPMQEIMTAWGWNYTYNRSGNFLKIGTNYYYMFGANTEASQDTLQGLTAAGALADEVALFPKSFTEQMIARCSEEGSKLFWNCNPRGPYHYLKTEYIDKVEEKHIYRLHFTMDDNLALPESTKDMYKRMYTGVFHDRYIKGLWVMAEGVIYDMFDKGQHVVESAERDYSSYYIAIDYGTNNPFAMGLWGLYEGTWYKVKEYHYDGRAEQKQKTDSEYARDFLDFKGDLEISGVVVDPSASSFIAELRELGEKVIKADNDVLDGIRNVQTALTTGQIKYNDCCKETFKEFSSYVWDEKAQERGEDKPVKQSDHHMDADRYFVRTILSRNKTKVNLVGRRY